MSSKDNLLNKMFRIVQRSHSPHDYQCDFFHGFYCSCGFWDRTLSKEELTIKANKYYKQIGEHDCGEA